MSRRNVAVVVAAAVAVAIAAGAACRKPAKVILTKDQRSRIEDNLLKEAPKPKHVVGANFGDNIRLIGMDLSADKVKPGEQLTITWYWETLKETPGEWKVFGHLELPGGKRMILDHTPVGELYPIGQWKKGEIIRDVQKVTIDAEAKAGQGTLWAGIFNEEIYRERGGGDRMQLVNKDKVTNDGDNRVRVVQFAVDAAGGAAAAKPPAVIKAFKAAGAIAVDGKADEADWTAATTNGPLGTADGKPADPRRATTLRVTYDDKALYFFFHVLDPVIEATFKDRDSELWTQDAIEIYLDPGTDAKDYAELQVSPANVIFDALFKSHRTPDWKEAKSWTAEGMQTAVVVTGTVNKADDQDTAYDVEVAVPFAAVPGWAKLPPDNGQTLRVNFFRMDAEGGKIVGAQAFSPAGGDFHDLSKAGTLEFSGVKPTTAPAPAPAPGAAAPGAPLAPAAGSQPLKIQVAPGIIKGATGIRAHTEMPPASKAPGK